MLRRPFAVVATPRRPFLQEPRTAHHASGNQRIRVQPSSTHPQCRRPEVDMNVEALQPACNRWLANLTDLNRLVAAHFQPTWREARQVDRPTRTVDCMPFDERKLTSNDVAPSSLVLVDRRCYPKACADDPETAGPSPKCAHRRKRTHISAERLSNRDTDLIVARGHDLQPADFIAATYPRHRHQPVLRVPVRFEFTDLHRRCAPSAATYCCSADRLLPTVVRDRYPLSPGTVLRDSSSEDLRTWVRCDVYVVGPVADCRVR